MISKPFAVAAAALSVFAGIAATAPEAGAGSLGRSITRAAVAGTVRSTRSDDRNERAERTEREGPIKATDYEARAAEAKAKLAAEEAEAMAEETADTTPVIETSGRKVATCIAGC